ncbi:MAG: hypothetical protein EA374_04210 [Acholeplasmatales bacterium]|nr:MAG: hypothetical protein EA374_04210 [Acholeplasmatales bacterium]
MSEMLQHRERINHLDEMLMRLLEERFAISTAVGDFKRVNHLPILDAAREAAILMRAEQHGPEVVAVYETILAQSRAVQERQS